MDSNFLTTYAPGNASGITATQDPSGRVSIVGSSLFANQGVNFYNKMDIIQKEGDIDVKQKLMSELESEFSVYNAERLQRALSLAEGQLGIQTLRQQLMEEERTDKADPKYHLYKSDSPSTAAVRERLRTATLQSHGLAEKLLQTDVERMRHGTAVGSFIKIQERVISDILRKQGITSEETDRVASTLTETNMEALRALYPEVTDDKQLKVKAAQLIRNPLFRDSSKVILDPGATPGDLLTAAIAGVDMAEPYVLRRQAASAKQSPEIVKKELGIIRKMVADPNYMQEMSGKYAPPEGREVIKQLLTETSFAKSKEQLHELQMRKIAAAVDIFKAMKSREFFGDVSQWEAIDGVKLQDIPELSEILSKGKPVDMATIFREYVGKASKEQKQERVRLLQRYAYESATKANGTLYGQVVDLSPLQKRIQALIMENSRSLEYNEADPLSILPYL
jgi:hypothetical protein